MGFRASEILLATSLGLGYAGATAMAVGVDEFAIVGVSTARCLDTLTTTLAEPSEDGVNGHCDLGESANELSSNPMQMLRPVVIGGIAVATASAITESKRRTDIKVQSFRWSPGAVKRRVL